jgi:hypothetical protein
MAAVPMDAPMPKTKEENGGMNSNRMNKYV